MPNENVSADVVAGKTLTEWREFARRDDCLDRMVPSDLRQIIAALSPATDSEPSGLADSDPEATNEMLADTMLWLAPLQADEARGRALRDAACRLRTDRKAVLGEAQKDTERLNWLQSEYNDVRWIAGRGTVCRLSDELGVRIVSHHMAEPRERIEAENWHEDLRGAIDEARSAAIRNLASKESS